MYATDNVTTLHPLGVALCALLGLLVLVLPRRHAPWPLLAMVCLMTMGQRVMLLDLNFTLMRILLLCAVLRVLLRGEWRAVASQPLDRALGWWVLASVVAYTLLWQTGEAFVNRLGLAYDALATYWVGRALLRDMEDLRRVAAHLAVGVVVLAAGMAYEKHSGSNLFAVFGGVPPETLVREGVRRAQGPFAHPILAGAFGSAMLPLMAGLALARGPLAARLLSGLGMAGAATMVVAAASSGPVMAAAAGLAGLLLWPLRRHMRALRWALLFALLGLHLVMAAPVWFLIARASVFGGSTGYFRAILIDHALRNLPQWWLVGVRSTADWGFHTFDVTNQYVLVGVQGGLLSLALFVLLIARGFGAAGTAVQALAAPQRGQAWFAWGLGCSLLAHTVNYLAVPYFDQNIINWYLLLAMLATAAAAAAAAAPAPVPAPAPAAPRYRRFTASPAPGLEGAP